MHVVTVLCVAFVALGAFATASDDAPLNLGVLSQQWSQFQRQHNKRYASPIEASFRQKIFADNLRYIDAHNRAYDHGHTTYRMAVNHLSDQLTHEVVAARTGFRPSNASDAQQESAVYFRSPRGLRAPASLNWADKGAVTPVKNQGQCGSCWAFSSTGALEGQHFLKSGKLVSLSEQNLVDCSYYQDNGCDGGTMVGAFYYVYQNGGIDTEESYPYSAQVGQCHYDASHSGATDKGAMRVRESEDMLLKALVSIGPIAVGIDVSNRSFQMYKSGVYFEPQCTNNINHAVLLVGYGTDVETGADYWLVKNSWGTQWGDKGYIKMARNRNNNCGIASFASFPVV